MDICKCSTAHLESTKNWVLKYLKNLFITDTTFCWLWNNFTKYNHLLSQLFYIRLLRHSYSEQPDRENSDDRQRFWTTWYDVNLRRYGYIALLDGFRPKKWCYLLWTDSKPCSDSIYNALHSLLCNQQLMYHALWFNYLKHLLYKYQCKA